MIHNINDVNIDVNINNNITVVISLMELLECEI